MKTLFSVLSIVLLSRAFAATPAATQAWVKNYVASHGGSAADEAALLEPTVVTVINDNGENETVTFHWATATNAALRVISSDTPGMPAGIRYASVGGNKYVCLTNLAATAITGTNAIIRYEYGDAKDVVVGNVTNTVYASTNAVWGISYAVSVNGTEFQSRPISDGVQAFIGGTNYFITVTDAISDSERTVLTSVPVARRSLSILDILLPSAYAISEGSEKFVRTERNPANPKPGQWFSVYNVYERTFVTDGDDAHKFTLDSVTWVDSNGNEATFEIDYTVHEIKAGENIEDFVGLEAVEATEENAQTIIDALKPYIGAGRYKQLNRGNAKAALQKKIYAIFTDYNTRIGVIQAYVKSLGPKPWQKKVFLGWHLSKCANHTWMGKCGDWYCKICGELSKNGSYDLPTTHHWVQIDDGCAFCDNKAGDRYCGEITLGDRTYYPTIDGHNLWEPTHDGKENRCKCDCYVEGCHGFLVPHEEGEIISYAMGTDGGCYRTWTCARCEEQDFYLQLGGVGGLTTIAYTPGDTATRVMHVWGNDGKFTCNPTNEALCHAEFDCDHSKEDEGLAANGCFKHISDDLPHEEGEKYKLVQDIPDDNENHRVVEPCAHGFFGWDSPTNNWCGYVFTNNLERHNYSGIETGRVGDEFCAPDSTNHYHYQFCGDIIKGEFDGTNTCGHIYQYGREHSWDLHLVGNITAKTHDLSNKCHTCQYVTWAETTNHWSSLKPSCYYLDEKLHAMTNVCAQSGCGHTYFVGNTNHVYNPALDPSYRYVDNKNHMVLLFCSDCTTQIPQGLTNHVLDVSANVLYNYLDENLHTVSNFCGNCHNYWGIGTEKHQTNEFTVASAAYVFAGNDQHTVWSQCARTGCTGKILLRKETCKIDWELGADLIEKDRRYCEKNCGNSVEYDHVWVFVDKNCCECSNGSHHLYTNHVYDDDDVCIKCGYSPTVCDKAGQN